jgi:hypothetical protein
MSETDNEGEGRKRQDFDPLLTPQEAVELLQHRISAKTLANWRSDGENAGPKFKKLGGRIYYRRSAVLTLVERDFDSTRDYKDMREERRRSAPAEAPTPAPKRPGDDLLAEFDAHIAEVRKMIVDKLADLSGALPKRPRGRPRGSKDKAPRRPPSPGSTT